MALKLKLKSKQERATTTATKHSERQGLVAGSTLNQAQRQCRDFVHSSTSMFPPQQRASKTIWTHHPLLQLAKSTHNATLTRYLTSKLARPSAASPNPDSKTRNNPPKLSTLMASFQSTGTTQSTVKPPHRYPYTVNSATGTKRLSALPSIESKHGPRNLKPRCSKRHRQVLQRVTSVYGQSA